MIQQEKINKYEEYKESELKMKKKSVTEQFDDGEDDSIDIKNGVYSKEFEKSLKKHEGINENETLLDLVQK